jgi:hypothetical protein
MNLAIIYATKTEAELLIDRDKLRKQLQSLVTGEAFASVSGGGKAFTRQQPLIRNVEDHLVAVSRALNAINATTYPLLPSRATRLHARFQ